MWNPCPSIGFAVLALSLVQASSADESPRDQSKSPLAIIPAKTCVVVKFKSPAKTIEKMALFAEQIQPAADE